MKSSEEMAKDILRRYEEETAKKKRRRDILRRRISGLVSAACCVALLWSTCSLWLRQLPAPAASASEPVSPDTAESTAPAKTRGAVSRPEK